MLFSSHVSIFCGVPVELFQQDIADSCFWCSIDF